MKAILTVSCKAPLNIFYCTECDFENYGSNVQITYVEDESQADQTLATLGVSKNKLTILRTRYQGSVKEGTKLETQNKAITLHDPNCGSVKFSFDLMDVFLYPIGTKIVVGENFAKLTVLCCFGNGEFKTDKTFLDVNCRLQEE